MFKKFVCLPVFLFSLNAQGNMPLEQKEQKAEMMFDYKSQNEEFWKKHLKPEVLNICRLKGTEQAGSGQYDQFYEKGTYFCACCGGDYPLFSSEAKFDSKTGWPSFWQPFNDKSLELREESLLKRIFGPRTEVLCARCGSHLGHVFDDGPTEHGGKRYCMNSLALHFTKEGQSPQRLYSVE